MKKNRDLKGRDFFLARARGTAHTSREDRRCPSCFLHLDHILLLDQELIPTQNHTWESWWASTLRWSDKLKIAHCHGETYVGIDVGYTRLCFSNV